MLVPLRTSDRFSADSVQLIQDFSPVQSWQLIWWLQKFFSKQKNFFKANRERMRGGMKKTHLWKCLLWQHLPLSLSALQLRVLHYSCYGCWCLILGSRCPAQTSAPKPSTHAWERCQHITADTEAQHQWRTEGLWKQELLLQIGY